MPFNYWTSVRVCFYLQCYSVCSSRNNSTSVFLFFCKKNSWNIYTFLFLSFILPVYLLSIYISLFLSSTVFCLFFHCKFLHLCFYLLLYLFILVTVKSFLSFILVVYYWTRFICVSIFPSVYVFLEHFVICIFIIHSVCSHSAHFYIYLFNTSTYMYFLSFILSDYL